MFRGVWLVPFLAVFVGCSSPNGPDGFGGIDSLSLLKGTVVTTNGGTPVAGAQVTVSATGGHPVLPVTVITDAQGGFSARSPTAVTTVTIDVVAADIVTRRAYATVGSGVPTREVTVGVFRRDGTFDLDFFRLIARGSTRVLLPYTGPPTLGVVTTDAGQPVNPLLLEFVEGIVRDAAPKLTNGALNLSVVRDPQSPMLTLAFSSESSACGSGSPQDDTRSARITLRQGGCGCGLYQIDPRTIRHYLGHALGLNDISDADGVMFYDAGNNIAGARRPQLACNTDVSSRESTYGGYLYARRYGNSEPDTDPAWMPLNGR